MTPIATDNRFIEPPANVKRKLLLVYAGVVTFSAGMVLLQPHIAEAIAAQPVCERFMWWKIVFFACTAPLPTLAVWFAIYAGRIISSQQAPPPRTWALHRTPIRRGPAVRHEAYAVIAASALAIATPLVTWSAIQPMFDAVKGECALTSAANKPGKTGGGAAGAVPPPVR